MVKFRILRFLLVAWAIAIGLSACGGSDSSTPATGSAAKTAEWTNVSVRALGDGTVNVNWDKAAVSGLAAAPSYNVYGSTNPVEIVQASNRIATGYQGQSFDHTNVTGGQRYYYVVTAVTQAGEGPASRPVSATPQAVLPAAPSGLRVTARDSSVKLELIGPTPPPATATATYNLYRSSTRNSFTAGNLIATNKPATALAPYTDAMLANGTTYYYVVTVVVGGKESRFGPVVSAQPKTTVAAVSSSPTQLAAFASPTDMSAEPGNASCIVKWTDVAALNLSGSDPATNPSPYYIVYWSDSPDVLNNAKGRLDNPTKDAGEAVTLTAVNNGINNGTMYYIQVVAAVRGSDGNPIPGRFTPGPVVSVTPSLKTPATPSGVSATQGSQQVLLTWNKDASGNSGVTYSVYFSTTDAATPAELMATGARKNNEDSSKTFYNHTGLDAGKTYYYVVTSALPGEGESAPSSIVSVTL